METRKEGTALVKNAKCFGEIVLKLNETTTSDRFNNKNEDVNTTVVMMI